MTLLLLNEAVNRLQKGFSSYNTMDVVLMKVLFQQPEKEFRITFIGDPDVKGSPTPYQVNPNSYVAKVLPEVTLKERCLLNHKHIGLEYFKSEYFPLGITYHFRTKTPKRSEFMRWASKQSKLIQIDHILFGPTGYSLFHHLSDLNLIGFVKNETSFVRSEHLEPFIILDLNGVLVDVTRTEKDTIITPKPGVDDFLDSLLKKYSVGVWTSRIKTNAEKIIKEIFKERSDKLKFIFTREDSDIVATIAQKDLSIFGDRKVVMVDDTPEKIVGLGPTRKLVLMDSTKSFEEVERKIAEFIE